MLTVLCKKLTTFFLEVYARVVFLTKESASYELLEPRVAKPPAASDIPLFQPYKKYKSVCVCVDCCINYISKAGHTPPSAYAVADTRAETTPGVFAEGRGGTPFFLYESSGLNCAGERHFRMPQLVTQPSWPPAATASHSRGIPSWEETLPAAAPLPAIDFLMFWQRSPSV